MNRGKHLVIEDLRKIAASGAMHWHHQSMHQHHIVDHGLQATIAADLWQLEAVAVAKMRALWSLLQRAWAIQGKLQWPAVPEGGLVQEPITRYLNQLP